jgi:predicted hotdog family 3-hydroxylacyl-ACP dehydratase
MSNFANILELIPQRPPLVLVDALIYSDAAKSTSQFTIPTEHLLVSNGALREPGILENVAQTAAARAGHELSKSNEPPKTGFIGDISNIEIMRLPAVGTTIKTTVTQLQQVFNITMVRGVVEDENGVIAQCEMKIVLLEPSTLQ